MCFFKLIHIEYRILSGKYFDHLRCKEVHIIHRMITDQQACLRSIFQDDQHATVHHEVNICTKDIHQLDGLLYDYVLRNIEDDSILRESCIKSCYAILGGISQLAVVLFYQFGMFRSNFFEAAEDDSFRQMSFRKHFIIKCVVYHKIQGCAHIRDIALKHFVRIDRNLKAVKVQTVIGLEILAYIRVFILLHLTGRESETLKIGKSSRTGCIQHFRTMLADHGFRLREEIYVLLFYIHRYSPTSFLIQSYPFSSSSKASSGPAVFTIRPL